ARDRRRDRVRHGAHVVTRQDGDDARSGDRLSDFDGPDARMRVGAAHERGMQHVGELDVVDELPPAREDPPILDPGDALPDELHDAPARSSAMRRDASNTPSMIDW